MRRFLGVRSLPRCTASQQLLGAAVQARRVDTSNLLELAVEDGLRLAISTSAASPRMLCTGRSARSGLARATHELARDRPRGGAQAADPRQAREDRVEVALVARLLEEAALLARPLQAAERGQAAFELGREREQVDDVLACVPRLLGESGRASQRVKLALLARRTPRISASSVSYEDCAPIPRSRRRSACRRRCSPLWRAPADERDVLAPGVDDHLDRGVGEHRRQRRAVEVLLRAGRSARSARDWRDSRRAPPAGSGRAACGSGPRP